MGDYETAGAAGVGALFAILGLWSVVGIGLYIWYLWSLSRLFPKLGLPSWAGWVPLWNQWQLIERGGLPGWLAVFAVVPGLSLVTLVALIIAIHRMDVEHGKGAGYTVLGILLPPVWAMLLTNHIGDLGYAAPAGSSFGSPAQGEGYPVGYGQSRASAQASGYGPSGVAQRGWTSGPQGGSGMPPEAFPGQPAAWQGLPPVAPEQATGSPGWYAPREGGTPAEAASQEAPSAPQPAFAQPPAAQPPARPARNLPEWQPAPSASQASGEASAPAPADWGFGRTTEGDFQRLAAEDPGARSAAPLGIPEPVRPFSWPGPDEPAAPMDPAPAAPMDPAPAASADPAPAAPAAPGELGDPEPAAAVPPAPAAPETAASEPPTRLPEPPTRLPEPPTRLPEPPPRSPEPPQSPISASPAPERSIFDREPGGPAVAAPRAAFETDEASLEDLDRTVVVPRRARWGIELPDGEVLELSSDDVVLGRKPEPLGGATTLRLTDPTRTVSKSHLRMRRNGDEWSLEDLHSTNGVAIIGESGEAEPVEPGHETAATARFVIGTLEVGLHRLD